MTVASEKPLSEQANTSKHDGFVRGFHHANGAYYVNKRSEGYLDSIMVGMYYPGGGTSGEFKIQWDLLNDQAVPRLMAYDDAWSALAMFRDLLDVLAAHDNQNITPLRMCALLQELGIADLTERVAPAR